MLLTMTVKEKRAILGKMTKGILCTQAINLSSAKLANRTQSTNQNAALTADSSSSSLMSWQETPLVSPPTFSSKTG